MLQIQPRSLNMQGGQGERWGLMQKVIGNGQVGMIGGEWWTGCVDSRVVESSLKKIEGNEGSLLGNLAEKGDRFGMSNFSAN